MAKSERQDHTEDQAFDAEDVMKLNLAEVQDALEVTGPWKFQWIKAEGKKGFSNKGPWRAMDITFRPVEPVGEGAEDVEVEEERLEPVYHRVFLNTQPQLRKLKELMTKIFRLEPDELGPMCAQVKGEFVVATAKKGNRGTELSAFRVAT